MQRILIANRGEIACRIIRTCHDMGIGTVAVFSDADRDARFVQDADVAVHIGPAESAASYLNVDAILDAARRTGAQAIHPGYGFLSENADFAQACADAGVVFIGPSPAAIAQMGSKIAAKALMVSHGVPVVPGFDGGGQTDAEFVAAADGVGFPVLVKASAGGGGKGMHVVRSKAELPAALASARRSAEAAFGDASLLLERYIEGPRHIEVQILGDSHGNVLHCFERECSIQRRHQKVIEEAPSPALTETQRTAITEAAVKAGQALSYQSAGTVEFILAPDGAFYFLEVNTRLQVEHPVTECITGLDLVRLQIQVARGEALPMTQAEVTRRGHAIEARIYAEDPAQDFLPQAGRLTDWWFPTVPGLRLDSGVSPGDAVPMYYDPMLAKVIAWGASRTEATDRLVRALEGASIQGIKTNRAFLADVLREPAWRAGDLTTAFIEAHMSAWSEASPPKAERDAALVVATLTDVVGRVRERALLPGLGLGWRNNRYRDAEARWRVADAEVVVSYRPLDEAVGWFVGNVDGRAYRARIQLSGRPGSDQALTAITVAAEVDGTRRAWRVVVDGARVWVSSLGITVAMSRQPRFPTVTRDSGDAGCRAPMPGKVVRVLVSAGDHVTAGDALVIVEAMKMEHTIAAPSDGVVADVLVGPDETVEADQALVVVEAKATEQPPPGS